MSPALPRAARTASRGSPAMCPGTCLCWDSRISNSAGPVDHVRTKPRDGLPPTPSVGPGLPSRSTQCLPRVTDSPQVTDTPRVGLRSKRALDHRLLHPTSTCPRDPRACLRGRAGWGQTAVPTHAGHQLGRRPWAERGQHRPLRPMFSLSEASSAARREPFRKH